MRVKIISDSTCDLSPELLERYDIAITPLCIIKDGEEFHDGVNITPADIFAHVDGGGSLCSTAAVSQYEYGEVFARYAKEYDAVVQVTIGANFSCCYQNACLAAQEFDNVYVVDSENLSSGQGLLVVAAAKLAANLLHLKPCIEVCEGKMGVCKKYRGSFEKCIRQYVKERLDGREDITEDLAFITHPACEQSVVDAAMEEAAAYGAFDELLKRMRAARCPATAGRARSVSSLCANKKKRKGALRHLPERSLSDCQKTMS